MGVHFTNHSPQLGVLVVVGFIVNADQDVFDGLRHDGALPQGTKLAPANNGRFGRNMGRLRAECLAIAGAAAGAILG
jgi:hypothetical protein